MDERTILDAHACYVSSDGPWQKRARLLQSLWRERKGYPSGLHGGRQLGSRLPPELGGPPELKGYLSDPAKRQVAEAVKQAPTTGAMLMRPRLWVDLLSSQPLCFNLFGNLAEDLDLATATLRLLWPQIISVYRVRFEYSPGRGEDLYTGNRSAFDIFVEYESAQGPAFLGIEVKYHEDLGGTKAADPDGRYPIMARELGIFRYDSYEDLVRLPLQQLWLDHLLALRLKESDSRWVSGTFVLLAPLANPECAQAARSYRGHLLDPSSFEYRTIEDLVTALRFASGAAWTHEVFDRYLNPAILEKAGFPALRV